MIPLPVNQCGRQHIVGGIFHKLIARHTTISYSDDQPMRDAIPFPLPTEQKPKKPKTEDHPRQ